MAHAGDLHRRGLLGLRGLSLKATGQAKHRLGQDSEAAPSTRRVLSQCYLAAGRRLDLQNLKTGIRTYERGSEMAQTYAQG